MDYFTFDWPRGADDALARLDEVYAVWVAGVGALDDAALAQPVGPAEGRYADQSYSTLVLHIHREAIHHLAEVALLRDLYAHRA